MSGATVAVNLTADATIRLAVSEDEALSSPIYSSPVETVNHRAKLPISGLDPGTLYYYGVEIDGVLETGTIGRFRTLDPDSGMLTVAVAGDTQTGSNHPIFDAIRTEDPDLFIHLGDAHYQNIDADGETLFYGAYNQILAASRQGQLFREVPIVYIWDDHDFGPNDSYAGSAPRTAAIRAYRRRVPHHPLAEAGDTDAVYRSFEVDLDGIGVVFVVTDQRSMASNKSATDNAAKTILGTAQKVWFKDLLSDAANTGKLFVWVCTRVWGGVPTVGADHWGGFTTERRELADHIKANALGRVLVLSADMHGLAIDDGTHHDFATGGGCPIPTFQAAPLDQTGFTTYGDATYSEGRFVNNNQYGLMAIAKTGASQLTVDWTGKRHTGAVLVTYQMVLDL